METYGGIDVNTNLFVHGPMDFAKTVKLRFHVGDLDQHEKRKRGTLTIDSAVQQVSTWYVVAGRKRNY